jgi:hypothetical protein
MVGRFLASTTLSVAIGNARHYWAAFDGTSSPQQQRVSYTRFRTDSKFRVNPLVAYYPGVLWINPTRDWVNQINFEDLARIGSWTASTTRATHYGGNQESLDLVDAYIQSNGVGAILNLIRSNNLDAILRTETEAA